MSKKSKRSIINAAVCTLIANFFGFSIGVMIASVLVFSTYCICIKKWNKVYKNTESLHIPRYFYPLLMFPFSIAISLYSMKVPGYKLITGMSFLAVCVFMVVFRLHVLRLYVKRDRSVIGIYRLSFITLSVGFFGLLIFRALNNIQNTIHGIILLSIMGVGLFIYTTMTCEQGRLYKYKNSERYLKRVTESFEERARI